MDDSTIGYLLLGGAYALMALAILCDKRRIGPEILGPILAMASAGCAVTSVTYIPAMT